MKGTNLKSLRWPFTWILVWLSLPSIGFALTPDLSAHDNTLELLAPGTSVSALQPYDAEGDPTALPQQGRYLLWVMPGIMALETRESIPLSEFSPGIPENFTRFNPTSLIPPFLELEPGFVLFYPGRDVFMPEGEERLEVAKRLAPYQALFDDFETLETVVPTEMGTRYLPVDGLYLVEDGVVRHRLLAGIGWPEEFAEPIMRDVQTFVEGEEPEGLPLALIPGTEMAADLPWASASSLLMTVSGSAAEAPSGSLRMRVEERPGGGSFTRPESEHPGALGRFLLEALSPLLESHGVQGVGVVTHEAERIPELEAAFPAWRFVAVESVADRLRLWELQNAVLLDSAGRVHTPFFVSIAVQPLGVRMFEEALEAVGQ